MLPSSAYAKGFLRTYALMLGLDAEELVDEYRRTADAEAQPQRLRPFGDPVLRSAGARRVWRNPAAAAGSSSLQSALAQSRSCLSSRSPAASATTHRPEESRRPGTHPRSATAGSRPARLPGRWRFASTPSTGPRSAWWATGER